MKTDLCHISDVFQKFSNFAYETYEIDPTHSYTLQGVSWQSMLKMTKIELELISDPDMYLFLMDTISKFVIKNTLQQIINISIKTLKIINICYIWMQTIFMVIQ